MNSLFDYSENKIDKLMESSVLLERFFKPKKKDDKKEPEKIVNVKGKELAEKLNINDFEDFSKFIEGEVRKEVNALKRDKSFNDKVKKDMTDLKRDDPYVHFKPNGKVDIGCSKFDWGDKYLALEIIIKEDQEINIVLGWIIKDIIKFINDKYKDLMDFFDIRVTNGDGDEGCIYFEGKKK